ncbi:MAG: hypothetical protein U0992_18430 [Planctomycetaceae bacterium]
MHRVDDPHTPVNGKLIALNRLRVAVHRRIRNSPRCTRRGVRLGRSSTDLLQHQIQPSGIFADTPSQSGMTSVFRKQARVQPLTSAPVRSEVKDAVLLIRSSEDLPELGRWPDGCRICRDAGLIILACIAGIKSVGTTVSDRFTDAKNGLTPAP